MSWWEGMLQVTKCDGGIRESKRKLLKATAANSGLCCGNLWKTCSALCDVTLRSVWGV